MARKTVAEREQEAYDREVARVQRIALTEIARLERREKMPAILFNLAIEAMKLRHEGIYIDAEILDRYVNDKVVDIPCVRFYFVEQDRTTILTIDSEEWEVDVLRQEIEQEKEKIAARNKEKALAEEAKKLLTPEQFEALRKHF